MDLHVTTHKGKVVSQSSSSLESSILRWLLNLRRSQGKDSVLGSLITKTTCDTSLAKVIGV